MDTQKDAITPDLRKIWYCLLRHRPVNSQFTEARATVKLLLLPNLPEPVPKLFFLHAVLDTFPHHRQPYHAHVLMVVLLNDQFEHLWNLARNSVCWYRPLSKDLAHTQ